MRPLPILCLSLLALSGCQFDLDATLAEFETAVTQGSGFDGLYKPAGQYGRGWDCRRVGEEGGAIRISGSRIDFLEHMCRLSSPTELSAGGRRYSGTCSGEGETWRETIDIFPATSGVRIRSDGYTSEWQRC